MPIKSLHYRLADIISMVDVSEATARRMIEELHIEPRRIPAGSSSRPVYSLDQVLSLSRHKRTRQQKTQFKRPLMISVYVPKGGVGKSTITNELAADFSLLGLNVLAIDLDDQASLTVMMGYQPDEVPDGDKPNPWLVEHTFLQALYAPGPGGNPLSLKDIIRTPYGEHGPKLVPADITLGELVYKLSNQANREKFIRQWVVTQADKDLKEYDIILVDNAPSTSVVSRASIVAADILIIPVRLDALTVKSIGFLANELNGLAEAGLDVPQVIAVPNFFRANNNRSARVMSALQRQFGEDVPIAPHIGESERFPKSLMFDVGRELEEVLPVAFENWNRSFERQHQEIRAVSSFVLGIASGMLKRSEPGDLFDEPKKQATAQ